MRQRLRNDELLDVLDGDAVRLVPADGLAVVEKLGILTYMTNTSQRIVSFYGSERQQKSGN